MIINIIIRNNQFSVKERSKFDDGDNGKNRINWFRFQTFKDRVLKVLSRPSTKTKGNTFSWKGESLVGK